MKPETGGFPSRLALRGGATRAELRWGLGPTHLRLNPYTPTLLAQPLLWTAGPCGSTAAQHDTPGPHQASRAPQLLPVPT